MARFDVYDGGEALLLDVQADTLPYLNTRLVVPMYAVDAAPRKLINILNPIVRFEGAELAILTQYAAAVPERDLGSARGSLAHEYYAIGRALDMLLTGI